MNLLESLLASQNGQAQENLSRHFNLDRDQAKGALDALLPGIVAGLRKNTRSENDVDSLVKALRRDNHQRYVEDEQAVYQRESIEDGKQILGHLFGSKDVSRGVARSASGESGVDYDTLKKMLPVVASMVMGKLSEQQSRSGAGGVGGMLEGLFSGNAGVSQRRTGGFLQNMLDSDGDGGVADDLINMAGGLFGRR